MAVVDLEVATADPALIARLAGPQGMVPGAAHTVHSGALLVYRGTSDRAVGTPAYKFRVEFGTPNVAAAAANWLWSQLHGHAAELRVAGHEVPLHHAALKAAMLDAAGLPQPV
jgi:hypothetical protein